MAILYLDGKRLKRLIHASAKWLLANEEALNEINVFPIPDGDTGTNMGLTLKSIVKSVSDYDGDHLSGVASNVADAALLGARGNSGIILSQIFKGFSESIGGKKRLNALDIAYSLKKAYEKAYNSISDPVEGTILTVIHDSVEAAYEKAKVESDITIIIKTLLIEAKKSLQNTPNLLPVLKKAGVVDAGAMGFVYIIEGIYMLLKGEALPEINIRPRDKKEFSNVPVQNLPSGSSYGYCIEFFIHGRDFDVNAIKNRLTQLGESLVIGESDNMVKVHIHSAHPDNIAEECLRFGTLSDIKIENMDDQHAEIEQSNIEKETIIIAVALGEGLKKIFKSLGCDYVITGGQTMNPSVEELNTAIGRFNAQNYIILPNNCNVISAAEQVKQINENKNIIVINTLSVPEGFSALIAYNSEFTIEENIRNISNAIRQVKTGEITKATKDFSTDKLNINKDDIIALYDNSITNTFKDTETAVIKLIDAMLDENDEIISLFYGQDVTEEKAKVIENKLKKIYNGKEVEVHHGGQPYYYYIVSIE